jgi:serine/threonine protein kinase
VENSKVLALASCLLPLALSLASLSSPLSLLPPPHTPLSSLVLQAVSACSYPLPWRRAPYEIMPLGVAVAPGAGRLTRVLLLFLPFLQGAASKSNPSPLKCTDKTGSGNGCSVAFTKWRRDYQIPNDELVCSVSILASVRTRPFACVGYSITKVTLQNSQHFVPFPLDITRPEPSSGSDPNCELYEDLKINLHDNPDLQAYFCGPGVQPDSCDYMSPTLTIATTDWNKTACSADTCPDKIPLTASLLLDIKTLPRSKCPTVYNGECGGTYGRSDNLPRGTCGCGEHNGIPEMQCNCDRGYFGDACQYTCPGGTVQSGYTGLVGCCSNHGTAELHNTSATEEPVVLCKCSGNFVGDACQRCHPGYYGSGCERKCPNCAWDPTRNLTRHEHCSDGLHGNGSCVCDTDWRGANCSVYHKNAKPVDNPTSWVFIVAATFGATGFLFVVAAVCWWCFRVSTQRSRALYPSAYDDFGRLRESFLSGASTEDRARLMRGSEMPLNSASPSGMGRGEDGGVGGDGGGQAYDKRLISSLLATRGPISEESELRSTQRLVAEIDRLSQSNVQYMIDYETLVLGSKIGTGTSGEVFRAEVQFGRNDTGTKSGGVSSSDGSGTGNPPGLVVALKRLYTATVNRKYFMNAFKRELAVLRRMEHPNIVRFIGITIAPPPENTYHVVTELCRCALNDLLERGRGKLPPTILANISHQIAEGMGYLHGQNVVHRDLKPANCLCAGGGDGGTSLRIKICDFGLSRLVSNDVTMMTADIGTPAYMAPEMAAEGELDSVEAGKAIDVYSFAVCLLEIWTQQKPYSGTNLNAFQLMIKVINGARPSVPGAHIVPKKVAETIENSWLKAPLLRPSFVEILAEMENDPHFWDLVSLQNSEEEPNDASVVVDLSV